MNYRLTVLTHGDHEHLEEVLKSYARNVQPVPQDVVIVYDGPVAPPSLLSIVKAVGAHLVVNQGDTGFCNATALAWEMSSAPFPYFSGRMAPEYVFHLEHDFVFRRKVDLQPIAYLLSGDKQIAQVSLMRQPVNSKEVRAGGVVASMPGSFERRMLTMGRFNEVDRETGGVLLQNEEHPYLVHAAYFTTNPSLMRRQFMADNPWPDYDKKCEGRFGLDLVARGHRFAVWGEGNPWVNHVGERNGHGY